MISTKCTLIVPFFNESKRWNETYWQELLQEGFNLIFVDDGSTDKTKDIISSFAKSENDVDCLFLKVNVGKANAVRQGLLQGLATKSECSLFGYLDADAAFAIGDIVNLHSISEQNSNLDIDAFWSSRVKLLGNAISRNFTRHYISRILTTYIAHDIPNFPYDSQSGLKLFRKSKELSSSLVDKFETRWFLDLELMLRLLRLNSNYKICEIPVSEWTDKIGSKIKYSEVINVLVEARFIRSNLKSNRLLMKKDRIRGNFRWTQIR